MAINQFHLEKLKGLDLFANQVVEGFITGLHKSPFHGFSVEFAEHRLYNTGESTKHIDWRLYARTDKLFVKRYEEETNLRCNILIDTSSSMYFGKNESETKINFSIYSAAALANLLKKQRDAFGVVFFDEKIHTYTEIKSHEVHYRQVLSVLENFIHEKNKLKKSSLANALHQIAETSHRRSLVLVFSDMFENIQVFEDVLGAMRHLKHNKHEIIFFHVYDNNLELELNYENKPYIFIDKETNEEIKLNPSQIKENYTKEALEFHQEIKMKCLQYKIDYVDCDIEKGYFPILQQYLIKRGKILR